jgi:hypothetical protein
MPAISLRAHYDGTAIRLDEPYELPRDAQLLVTVLAPVASDDERTAWGTLAAEGLAGAYGDNEPEYSSADIVP